MNLDAVEWKFAKIIIDEKVSPRITAMASHYITVSGGFSI
jgi:hypothetical protein